MASINSKEKPKAGRQLLYNLHGMHLVALSQRPPEISYILLCCAQMAAVFSLATHSHWVEILTGSILSLLAFSCKNAHEAIIISGWETSELKWRGNGEKLVKQIKTSQVYLCHKLIFKTMGRRAIFLQYQLLCINVH